MWLTDLYKKPEIYVHILRISVDEELNHSIFKN